MTTPPIQLEVYRLGPFVWCWEVVHPWGGSWRATALTCRRALRAGTRFAQSLPPVCEDSDPPPPEHDDEPGWRRIVFTGEGNLCDALPPADAEPPREVLERHTPADEATRVRMLEQLLRDVGLLEDGAHLEPWQVRAYFAVAGEVPLSHYSIDRAGTLRRVLPVQRGSLWAEVDRPPAEEPLEGLPSPFLGDEEDQGR
jgi:hypothetical protein